MGRIVFVSNRVADLSKASQAGGVAVAIADTLRARKGLWFGWSGKIGDRSEELRTTPNLVEFARHDRRDVAAKRSRARGLLPRLLEQRAVAGFSLPPRPCAVRSRLLPALSRREQALRPSAAAAAQARRHDLGARLSHDPAWASSCARSASRIRSAFSCTFPCRRRRRSSPSPSIASSRAALPPTI